MKKFQAIYKLDTGAMTSNYFFTVEADCYENALKFWKENGRRLTGANMTINFIAL